LGTSVVKLKSRDGSDVFLDITITYTIDPAKGEVVAREIGVNRSTPNPQILISYARSLVRDEFGKLSIEEVIDASTRNEAVLKLRDLMAKDLEPFGIVINTIAVQNPNFNPQFEELIKQRKSADQELTNQASAQDSAQSDQERQVSEAQRVKETTIREDEGKQRRRIIEAEAAAEERKRLAEGEAYRIRVDGERSKEVAEQTAQAVLTEGLKRAEGVQKMAEAYQANGLGQVRAALAEKFIGTRIMGRPYSLSSTVDRLRVEENEAGNEGIDDEARKQAAAATMTQ
jgi:regulator of protease activity HflC (stomatin/prohibitin superfamily)